MQRLLNYLMQRHPDLWHEPDRFNPDRFGPGQPYGRHRMAMLEFSAGPRNCYVQEKPPELNLGVNLRSKDNFIMTPAVNRIS
jgi:hypothetical protein